MRFRFGRNWKNYVRRVVNENIIQEASMSLLKYLSAEEYKGKVFIDVGCGSGLFSLAALLLGAKKVISFDYDVESVEATLLLRDRFQGILPQEYDWNIFQADILSKEVKDSLYKKGDIVYAWGVLHHTGRMWDAIQSASDLVADNGYLIMSIYNHSPVSETWKRIKKFYVSHPLLQPLLSLSYGLAVVGMKIYFGKPLIGPRGMHAFYDAVDWIGGYPYEYACAEEVIAFVEGRGLKLVSVPTVIPCGKEERAGIRDVLFTRNIGCNEFVFAKKCAG